MLDRNDLVVEPERHAVSREREGALLVADRLDVVLGRDHEVVLDLVALRVELTEADLAAREQEDLRGAALRILDVEDRAHVARRLHRAGLGLFLLLDLGRTLADPEHGTLAPETELDPRARDEGSRPLLLDPEPVGLGADVLDDDSPEARRDRRVDVVDSGVADHDLAQVGGADLDRLVPVGPRSARAGVLALQVERVGVDAAKLAVLLDHREVLVLDESLHDVAGLELHDPERGRVVDVALAARGDEQLGLALGHEAERALALSGLEARVQLGDPDDLARVGSRQAPDREARVLDLAEALFFFLADLALGLGLGLSGRERGELGLLLAPSLGLFGDALLFGLLLGLGKGAESLLLAAALLVRLALFLLLGRAASVGLGLDASRGFGLGASLGRHALGLGLGAGDGFGLGARFGFGLGASFGGGALGLGLGAGDGFGLGASFGLGLGASFGGDTLGLDLLASGLGFGLGASLGLGLGASVGLGLEASLLGGALASSLVLRAALGLVLGLADRGEDVVPVEVVSRQGQQPLGVVGARDELPGDGIGGESRRELGRGGRPGAFVHERDDVARVLRASVFGRDRQQLAADAAEVVLGLEARERETLAGRALDDEGAQPLERARDRLGVGSAGFLDLGERDGRGRLAAADPRARDRARRRSVALQLALDDIVPESPPLGGRELLELVVREEKARALLLGRESGLVVGEQRAPERQDRGRGRGRRRRWQRALERRRVGHGRGTFPECALDI